MDRRTLVEALAKNRLTGAMPEVPELDGDFAAALKLQLDVLRALEQQGETLSGWKVGLTSGPARDAMGVGFRPFGYLLASRTLVSGMTLPLKAIPKSQIEPEICLRMKTSLRGSSLSPEKCRAAVAQIHAAFEINEIRVEPRTPKLFVADDMTNWGIVVGDGAAPRDNLAGTKAELFVDDKFAMKGAPDFAMDDPFLSLSRLCAQLDAFGLGVEAGQYVLTGALFKHSVSAPGSHRAVFDGIGEVILNVS